MKNKEEIMNGLVNASEWISEMVGGDLGYKYYSKFKQ